MQPLTDEEMLRSIWRYVIAGVVAIVVSIVGGVTYYKVQELAAKSTSDARHAHLLESGIVPADKIDGVVYVNAECLGR